MTNQQRKQKLIETSMEYLEKMTAIANEKMGANIPNVPRTEFDFSLRGSTAGQAHGMRKLRYNLEMASLNETQWDIFLTETVPHECAHIVVNAIRKYNPNKDAGSSHGRVWAYLMRQAQVAPKRCHKMDYVPAKKTRKFLWKTDNGMTVELGAIRHNRIIKGEKKYAYCGFTITEFIKEIKE